jgi:choline dehydrogenase-like flavoprotein
MNDPVDVLIIGAGASGAAVAWSLAETRMHILCLEQGKEILRRRGNRYLRQLPDPVWRLASTRDGADGRQS